MTSTEGCVTTQTEEPPIIEDINMTIFLTDTQHSPGQVDWSSPRIPKIEHKATSSSEVPSDLSAASDDQLQTLLEQAFTEAQNRWVYSQLQIQHIETSVERVWKQCREALSQSSEPFLMSRAITESTRWQPYALV